MEWQGRGKGGNTMHRQNRDKNFGSSSDILLLDLIKYISVKKYQSSQPCSVFRTLDYHYV
jgi:hypothetical protein